MLVRAFRQRGHLLRRLLVVMPLVANPVTCSTPTRLYRLRSKTMISPAAATARINASCSRWNKLDRLLFTNEPCNAREPAMRVLLFALGLLAALITINTPAAA